MSTAEDVFYLYERNLSYYYDCKQRGEQNSCISYILTKECKCSREQIVIPQTIGNIECSCCLNRKCYIKPGTECPICFDNILKKSEAYLTCCGHAFHKKCIFNAFKQKLLFRKNSNFGCPLCRRRLGYELFDINTRYAYNDKRGLDDLEEFTCRNEYMIPSICFSGNDHYLGMKKECKMCDNYRKTGSLL